MDFFFIVNGAECTGCVKEEVGLLPLLFIDRVVEDSTDVEREVNVCGGNFALSVSVSFLGS